MADNLSAEDRLRAMRAVRSKDTSPERIVRSLLHRRGYRFRLHRRDLPGSPDIVLPRYQTVIFVHGCYWHRHSCKKGRSVPTTRREWWLEKFERNKARDSRVARQLRKLGWRVITVWECETKPTKLYVLERKLRRLIREAGQ